VQHVSDLHPEFALRHTICGSMVEIQSATAEIRQGKKERKKKPQGKNIMSASATQGGHNNSCAKYFKPVNGFLRYLLRLVTGVKCAVKYCCFVAKDQ